MSNFHPFVHYKLSALKVAAKDKLNELQLRIRQLLDQVEQIAKEQNYQRYRYRVFRLCAD